MGAESFATVRSISLYAIAVSMPYSSDADAVPYVFSGHSMIRCPKCGATNADGRRQCAVCNTRLDQGQTSEIESDVVAALAALGAARPAASTVVRNEGPRTLFGKNGHDDALGDFPHPVLDGESGLLQTIIKTPKLPQMFGAGAQRGAQYQDHEEAEGTLFGIGSAVDDDESAEMTAFGVGAGDSSMNATGSSVPDWIAGLEDELLNSDEFDRFVGPGPSSSAIGNSHPNGVPRATPGGAATSPVDRFQIGDQTELGIPGEAEHAPTVFLSGRPAPFGALPSDEPAIGDGAGVLKRRRRPTSKRTAASSAPGPKQSRDMRFESPPPQAQPAASKLKPARTTPSKPNPARTTPSKPNPARTTPRNDPALGDTFAAPSTGPTARGAKTDRDKPLEFADTGALDAVSQPRQTPGPAKGPARPTPARTPAPPRGPVPVPRTPGATAPDAAWDVFVPSAADLARTDLGQEPARDAEQGGGVEGDSVKDAASTRVRQPISASRIVATVAIVVAIVCVAFGAFLVWLVDRG